MRCFASATAPTAFRFRTASSFRCSLRSETNKPQSFTATRTTTSYGLVVFRHTWIGMTIPFRSYAYDSCCIYKLMLPIWQSPGEKEARSQSAQRRYLRNRTHSIKGQTEHANPPQTRQEHAIPRFPSLTKMPDHRFGERVTRKHFSVSLCWSLI
jgi:hypothetical protein